MEKECVRLSDLKNVEGIGPKTLERIRKELFSEKTEKKITAKNLKKPTVFEDATLFHEDCMDVLDFLVSKKQKIDLIIVDPPYHIENTKAGGQSDFANSFQKMNNEIRDNGLTKNLGINFCKKATLLQDNINIYIFCNKKQIIQYLDYYVKELGCSFDIIVWGKTNAPPTFHNKYLTDKEYCLYFRRGGICSPSSYDDAKTIYLAPINIKDKKKYDHPTIKPSPLIDKLIKNSSKEGDLVADFFMGSGTTGERSLKLKRRFLGAEINEKYFNTSVKRIKKYKDI